MANAVRQTRMCSARRTVGQVRLFGQELNTHDLVLPLISTPQAKGFHFGSTDSETKIQREGDQGMSNQAYQRTIDKYKEFDMNQTREKSQAIASYYSQSAIEAAGAKNSVRLTPSSLLYAGKSADGNHILRSAQYLHKELPVRVAHRVLGFRQLPFIVGCNPTILSVHELYIRAFNILSEFPPIVDFTSEQQYSQLLRTLLDAHKDVVTHLAAGFKECKKHMKNTEEVQHFLDRTLTSRMGIRLLTEHHIALHEEQPNFVGIINVDMSLRKQLEKWSEYTKRVCEHRYGRAPRVIINGHLNAHFAYLEQPLSYILSEVLKNAMRATLENHVHDAHVPDISVTIANNEEDFIIRFSDRGGGIPHELESKVFEYHFTTAESESPVIENADDRGFFNNLLEGANRGPSGPMYGYGFGLSTARAYAKYMGGSLTLESLQGIGTDVYLRLKHIEARNGGFRI